MPEDRRLAAIMFTDIVGYTALMGEDEQRAFQLLKRNRQVQRPIIEKHDGKWLKEIGDGVLASFPTVSEAVYCAKEIQETCKNEPDLKLRIGIHLGEVVFEADDVFGDGVNIASRLEPLAPIGGILVSESVHKNVLNKKGIESEFIREEHLKNVKEPVRIYEVKVEGVESPKPDPSTASDLIQPQISTEQKPSSQKKVFAVVLSALIILAIVLTWWMLQPAADIPLVVMMDSSHPARVYDKETIAASATNADVISDMLLDLPIRRQKETISPGWHRDEEILNFDPALVIIHYSGFRQEDGTGPRIRLKLLIEFLADSETKFLIYSRAKEDSLEQRVNTLLLDLDIQHPDLLSRIYVFGLLDYGKPSLKDPVVANSLKLRIKQILGFE
ncbi:adenylate/guanylate cyclase domain-containing protein [Bacteroidota bacterium]